MNKTTLFLISLSLMVYLFTGCESTDSSTAEEEKVPVEISKVTLGEVVQTLSFTGDIKAEYEVKVFSKIPDRIDKYFVDEGDKVQKGQQIAQILATTIEQSVLQAEAALNSAKAQAANMELEYQRAKRLNREDAMSQQQYDAVATQYKSVQAQVQQAEAALASAKSQLNDATITAPISGIIGKRYYEAGDMANMAQPVVSIVQMDRVKIEFDATEQDLGKLALGQKAEVKVRSYPDRQFSGKVSKISPILDPLTRMAEVEVLVDNPERLLKPGMFANVDVTTGVYKDVLVVPRYVAIENTTLEKVEGEDQVVKNYYVFVVNGSTAVQKKLEILYANHRTLAVDSGLAVGDQLVIAGQNNLRDGMPVSIVNTEGNEL